MVFYMHLHNSADNSLIDETHLIIVKLANSKTFDYLTVVIIV